jgi:antitoxin ParD1/3/4
MPHFTQREGHLFVSPKFIETPSVGDCSHESRASASPLNAWRRWLHPPPVWHLLTSIASMGVLRYRQISTKEPIVSSTLNVQLTDALRKYVDERASDKDVYATPSEYIRDLIRQDMQDRAVALNILEGLGDLRHGRFSDKSILDFKDED